MSGTTSRRPDVVLVVMDCARADVFATEVARARYTPFLRQLRSEVVEFTGAISPGSWTIPSHASLFTGLYPWDHRAHARAGTTLPAETETLANQLARAGYATASFSANGYVQPASGLTRGFEEVAWGGDREFFLRFLATASPSNPDLGGRQAAAFNRLPDSPPPSPLWNAVITALSRYTALWDGVNRVGVRLLGHDPADLPLVAPWIEPRMEAWLAGLAPDRPALTFVNLLEAHEPYLVDAGQPVSLGRWLSYLRDVQGEYVWVQGRWTPSPAEVARGRERYARSFQAIDERVRRLVELLRRTGRWENTLFVLTSDHGQAFLEHGTLYHRFRVDEEITRVPLWVHFPKGDRAGEVDDRWVSLIDVPRTAVELADPGAGFGDPGSRSLLRPDRADADRPVFSLTDGLMATEARHLPADRERLLNRLELAVYRGEGKCIADGSPEPPVFAVSSRDPAQPVGPRLEGPRAREIAELARTTYDRVRETIAHAPERPSVLRHLAGWGY